MEPRDDIYSATIDPTPEFRGHTLHANPWRGIRRNSTLAAIRYRAESAIIVHLAGPEAQQRHNPRSWRAHHGAADFKQAVDLASRFNRSDEAARAYLDWLAIVTRDEHEGFQCRVLSAGDARRAPGSGWHDVF